MHVEDLQANIDYSKVWRVSSSNNVDYQYNVNIDEYDEYVDGNKIDMMYVVCENFVDNPDRSKSFTTRKKLSYTTIVRRPVYDVFVI